MGRSATNKKKIMQHTVRFIQYYRPLESFPRVAENRNTNRFFLLCNLNERDSLEDVGIQWSIILK